MVSLIDASVAGEEGAAPAQLIEDGHEEAVELWLVERAEEALKVAMHPCGQPRRELSRALDVDSATDAVRPKQVPEQRRQLTPRPSEDGVVPQTAGRPDGIRNRQRKRVHCATMLCASYCFL